ncbi:MAG: HAD family hydrolase [Candidatus Electrothrix sp. MAN1_4]|nr:HAD family hydrolase [Candidatus Electrothrix sp. MAN1_4]
MYKSWFNLFRLKLVAMFFMQGDCRLMLIDNRLLIPETTQAILWDMDGVLLDTLGLDLTLCNQLLHKHINKNIHLSKGFIRSVFAYHPPEFWRLILNFVATEHQITVSEDIHGEILEEYNKIRNDSSFEVNPGIIEILQICRKDKILLAVVSNNPTDDVRKILAQSGLADFFDLIVGNDLENLRTKPAPDTYLYAAKLLNVSPEHCAVIEDSLLGAEAGSQAGCFTIGVATGGAEYSDLEQVEWTQQVYSSFKANHLTMELGAVTNKQVVTPNDFVSHMVEHIAWRTGCSIDLHWNNNDWFELGTILGASLSGLLDRNISSGAALGMIDDGSAEVSIALSGQPESVIDAAPCTDLDWFLSLRCEQLKSGKPLTNLLRGVANGLRAKLHIQICSAEDPHHTWEGIFRAIGIALSRII